MRTTQMVIAASILLTASRFAAAQGQRSSDWKLDHLAGAVRSAVTRVSPHESGVTMPNGPSVVLPIWCDRCEYDPDGSKTLSETQQASGPIGEKMSIQRDSQGQIYQRRTMDLQTGLVIREEQFGPYGVVDDRRYMNGKLTDEFLQDWDDNGHRSTFIAKDGHGNQISHRHETFTRDGVLTEDTSWRADGTIEWRNHYDPATGVSEFKNYDTQRKLRLSRRSVHDRLISFWTKEENLYGSDFFTTSELHRDENICHLNGQCDHLTYDYLDEDGRNPKRIELRNPAGALIVSAYYDYAMDAHDNWIRRTVRVRTSDAQKPVVYEVDSRTLLYWP